MNRFRPGDPEFESRVRQGFDAPAVMQTIQFKINLLAAAGGDLFRAIGQARKSGESVFVSEADLLALSDDDQKPVAAMTAALTSVYPWQAV